MESIFECAWQRRSTVLCLVPALALLVALILVDCAAIFEHQKPVRFRTMEEVRELAERHDLLVVEDELGFHEDFYVIEKPVPPSRLRNLRKNRCGQTAGWKGVVWVVSLNPPAHATRQIYPEGISGNSRIWGNVLAAGDENLLIKFEKLYQHEQTNK